MEKTSSISTLSVSDGTCRICLENGSDSVSVFAQWDDGDDAPTFVAQIITECTAVQVIENDGLPENICKQCATQLKLVSIFIKKARKSDHVLRSQTQCKNQLNGSLEEKHDFFKDVSKSVDTDNSLDESHSDKRIDSGSDDPNESDWSENEYKVDKARIRSEPEQIVESAASHEGLEYFKIIVLDRDQWLCCACWKHFNNKQELEVHCDASHMNIHTNRPGKKFACRLCHRSYSSAVAASAHRRKVEAVTLVYECKLCDVRLLEQPKCHQHARLHDKKQSPTKKRIKPTMQDLYERFGRLCCALGCTESFETEEQLRSHAHSIHKVNKVEGSLTYNEGKPIECPICFKRFKQDESLDRHQRFKYNESSNICMLCGAKFPTLTSLTIHERSHTKEKPFQCEVCSKAFGDKQSLKRHYVKHTDDKPFMCSICGTSFKRKRAMQSHMIIHAPGQLPFKCELCEKRFRVKAKLLYHMRTHTGEKPYSCRFCDKSFADFSNRMRHEQSHTGEKPYKCSYCPMGFITKRFMLQHEKNHKQISISDEPPSKLNNT